MSVLIFVWPKFTNTASHCAFLHWLHKPFVNQYFLKPRFYNPSLIVWVIRSFSDAYPSSSCRKLCQFFLVPTQHEPPAGILTHRCTSFIENHSKTVPLINRCHKNIPGPQEPHMPPICQVITFELNESMVLQVQHNDSLPILRDSYSWYEMTSVRWGRMAIQLSSKAVHQVNLT